MLLRKSILTAVVVLAISGAVLSGDRMGNGGDIRRFRVTRTLGDIRWSASAYKIVFSSGKCGDLVDSEIEEILPQLEAAAQLLSFAEARWSFTMDLPVGRRPQECMQYSLPEKSASGYLDYSFYYENCPKTYSRNYYFEQVIRPVRDRLYPEYSVGDLAAIFIRLVKNVNDCAFRNVGIRQLSDDQNFTVIRSRFWQNSALLASNVAEARGVISRNLAKRMGGENSRCRDYCLPAAVEIPGGLEPGFSEDREIPYTEILTELEESAFVLNKTLDSCAQTQPARGQPIYFNPVVCGMVTDTLDLAWILAHEMAHHFGIRDEFTADYFAAAVVAMSARN